MRLLLAGLAFAAIGCGEQDLYEPPVSPYSRTGTVAMPSEAYDVDIFGNYAYVAAGQGGLRVVSIADPDNPVEVTWADSQKRADRVRVARVYDGDGTARDIAFVVDGTEGVTTYDISEVPENVRRYDTGGTTAVDGKGICVVQPDLVGDPYAVYLADSWKGIRINVSNPEVPGKLTYLVFGSTYGYTQALDVQNDRAYIADDEMGITVLDVSEWCTGCLVILDNLDTAGNAYDVDVVDDHVYVADGLGGLVIMQIDENQLLAHTASLELNGECVAVKVSNNVAFLAAKEGGLHVVDVSSPASPVYLGNVVTSYAVSVAVNEENIVCVADEDEGLIVFRGPIVGPDTEAPAAVIDLGARLQDVTTLDLTWTAPGDDGDAGLAILYDVRWSTSPIADSTWESAEAFVQRPLPKAAGTAQGFTVEDLTAGLDYYFALKTWDEEGNLSELSNIATARMTIPSLSGGTVSPDSGDAATAFTYSVTYQDSEGESPLVAQVLIDGEAFDMAPADAEPDYITGAVFQYGSMLDLGSHAFQFTFDDGHGPLITTAVVDGPKMPADPFAFEMISLDVAGGTTFTMGSSADELGRDADETAHQVTLTGNFEISNLEVSQALYREVMGRNPAYFAGDARPVENVTWYDAASFCNALSAAQELDAAYDITVLEEVDGSITLATVIWNPDANGYRLPTEAEWEYACRAGSATSITNGDLGVEDCTVDPFLDLVGWYCGNADQGSGPRTQDIGLKDPNAFALYDMHGNVWEWCWDAYAEFTDDDATDPTGSGGETGQQHVRRGGSWFYFARDCRSASRDPFWPGSADHTVGFRIARDAQ